MKHFFIVGAQRSGTTWLYHMLSQHPQILMAEPVRPEPKYFLRSSDSVSKTDYQTSYFSKLSNKKMVCGEKSTTYIESENAAKLIASTFPSAKIIMMLRDPAQRAISNYNFSVNNGLESRSIADALFDAKARPKLEHHLSTDPFNYLARGQYEKYIHMYLKYFSGKNIKIVTKENATTNVKELQAIYDFLGVDADFIPEEFDSERNRSNESGEVPEYLIEKLNDFYSDTVSTVAEYCDVSGWK